MTYGAATASTRSTRWLECWNEDVMRGQLMQGLDIRLHMLKAPEVFPEQMISFEMLCTPNGNPYTDWAVPFWTWYRDHGQTLDPAYISWVARGYALSYGRPELNDGRDLLRVS